MQQCQPRSMFLALRLRLQCRQCGSIIDSLGASLQLSIIAYYLGAASVQITSCKP